MRNYFFLSKLAQLLGVSLNILHLLLLVFFSIASVLLWYFKSIDYGVAYLLCASPLVILTFYVVSLWPKLMVKVGKKMPRKLQELQKLHDKRRIIILAPANTPFFFYTIISSVNMINSLNLCCAICR